jgi:hypothetical protein
MSFCQVYRPRSCFSIFAETFNRPSVPQPRQRSLIKLNKQAIVTPWPRTAQELTSHYHYSRDNILNKIKILEEMIVTMAHWMWCMILEENVVLDIIHPLK